MFHSAKNQRIAWQWDGVTIELDAYWCGKVRFAFVAPFPCSMKCVY